MLGTASASLATGRNVGTAAGLAIAGAVLVTVATSSAGIDTIENAKDLPASALLDGIRAAFLVASGLSLLGAIASSTRPATVRPPRPERPPPPPRPPRSARPWLPPPRPHPQPQIAPLPARPPLPATASSTATAPICLA